MPQLANLTGQHHRPRLLQRCDIAIGQVDHGDEPGALRGVGHFRGLGVVFRKRFFAQHVFAGGQQGQRRRMVRLVRRHIRRRIELAPSNGIVERSECIGYAMFLGKILGALGVDIDRPHHLHTFDLSEGFGMAVGHAAGSDNKKTHSDHLYPASPASCSLGPRSTIGSRASSTGTFGASWIAV
ncbi:hypothetical protein FQZ97_998190 [compost metagenome]